MPAIAVNFNGTNFGAMEIFVPANTNLNLTLINAQSLPHNLVLVQNTKDVANNGNVAKDGSVLLAIGATTTNYLNTGKSIEPIRAIIPIFPPGLTG